MLRLRSCSALQTSLAAGFLCASIGVLCSSCKREESPVVPTPAAQPDVIWIVVDTLRRDRLGCYGHARATSPAIDALAKESIVFERALTTAPWTTPAIGALLTGQPPSTLGLIHERMRLAPEWSTAAELFAAAGYRTAGVVSHSYCSSLQNFGQGFESFDESNVRGYAESTSPGVTARALEAIEREDARPLFLFVHYFDPHFAFLEHPAHTFGDASDYEGPIRAGQPHQELQALATSLAPADINRLFQLYDSEIAFTDHSIGVLLDGLRQRSPWNRTIVALTADHGEAFGEHQSVGHGTTLFSEALDVPLILRVPGRPSERIARDVSTLGLLPTCAALAGLEELPAMLGSDWLAHDAAREPVFAETNQGSVQRSVLDGSAKLIVDLVSLESRLFHLGLDPGETADRSALYPGEVARLHQVLTQWLEISTNPRFDPVEADLDAAAIERLQSLGYLGGKSTDGK